jgi:hypothetical protein
MKRSSPLEGLEALVFEGGFSSKRALEEFCIAVGLFHDRRSAAMMKAPPGGWDPSRYSIWPMLQVIAHDMDPEIETMDEMRGMLYPYLLGGSEMLRETVKGSEGNAALLALSRLIPP